MFLVRSLCVLLCVLYVFYVRLTHLNKDYSHNYLLIKCLGKETLRGYKTKVAKLLQSSYVTVQYV